MKKTKTHIEGLYIIENKIQKDIRGKFMEFWNDNKFQKANLNINFSQDNISTSKKNASEKSIDLKYDFSLNTAMDISN